MAACPRCGSRSVRIVLFNPLVWFVHLVTDRRKAHCPRCGWDGWQSQGEWLHIKGAGIYRGGTGHTGSRRAHRKPATHHAGAEAKVGRRVEPDDE